jgi:hypothetical protein
VSYGASDAPQPDWTTTVYGNLPPELSATQDVILARQGPEDDAPPVNEIVMQGGGAAIVQPSPAPGAPGDGSTIYLVTDAGLKYPIGNSTEGSVEAAISLGYAGVQPIVLPTEMLDAVPVGPNLDRKSAARPVVNGAPAIVPPVVSPSPSPSLVTATPPAG